MITKRKRLPASAHTKRPTERPSPRGRTPRWAPALTIEIEPMRRKARPGARSSAARPRQPR